MITTGGPAGRQAGSHSHSHGGEAGLAWGPGGGGVDEERRTRLLHRAKFEALPI